MDVRFSDRANGLKASEIRELLKLAEMPEIISFAGGLPAPELFPIKEMAEVLQEVMEKDGRAALQYGPTEGIKALREVIVSQRMPKVGLNNLSPDEIAITTGSQQGLDFSAKIFLNKDDVVICESPSYLGAVNAFKAYEPKFVEIPCDEQGMLMDKLEEALIANPDAKMIYIIPDFQNPTGRTLPIERRKIIAELASKYKIPVIEDGPYSELIFEGSVYPSIKSFDKEGWVVYLGTYSKTFAPGIRIGWIYASPEILNKYIIIKQGADLQCSSLDQRAVALFMKKNSLDNHIEKIIKVYRGRRDLMLESMAKYFPAGVKVTKPAGGLFAWVELKEGLDSAEIMQECLKENVAYVPGASFFPNGSHHNFFRMNFSCMNEEKIVEGVKRLGAVLAKFY